LKLNKLIRFGVFETNDELYNFGVIRLTSYLRDDLIKIKNILPHDEK